MGSGGGQARRNGKFGLAPNPGCLPHTLGRVLSSPFCGSDPEVGLMHTAFAASRAVPVLCSTAAFHVQNSPKTQVPPASFLPGVRPLSKATQLAALKPPDSVVGIQNVSSKLSSS